MPLAFLRDTTPVENKISEDLVETKDLHLLKPPQRDLIQRCV